MYSLIKWMMYVLYMVCIVYIVYIICKFKNNLYFYSDFSTIRNRLLAKLTTGIDSVGYRSPKTVPV